MARRRPENPTPPLAADWLAAPSAPAPARTLPIGTQPLFLPALVEQAARSPHVGAHSERIAAAHEAFRAWNAGMRAGGGNLNESQIEQTFNQELLGSLGYQGPLQFPGAAWSMQPKLAVPGVGQADIALGRFTYEADGRLIAEVRAIVELKGPRIDLDRAGSRARSAVQQAWDYLNAFESARWAVVTNGVEARLYSKRKGTRHAHRVILDDLDDEPEFRRFYALFCADSLLPTATAAFGADRLLAETDEKQEAVGSQLYDAYEAHRKALVREILARRPGVGLDRAIEAAQTLLDRILFIAFAEDRGLLGDRPLLERVATTRLPGVSRWAAFRALFHAFDRGDPSQRIDPYNGSLFKPDTLLDDPAFELDDDRWPDFFRQIGGYDFRHEVTPDVLGHIFERSITAIEDLRQRGPDAEPAPAAKPRKAAGRRRREGVFYTARPIVDYLVAAALEPAWDDARAAPPRTGRHPIVRRPGRPC